VVILLTLCPDLRRHVIGLLRAALPLPLLSVYVQLFLFLSFLSTCNSSSSPSFCYVQLFLSFPSTCSSSFSSPFCLRAACPLPLLSGYVQLFLFVSFPSTCSSSSSHSFRLRAALPLSLISVYVQLFLFLSFPSTCSSSSSSSFYCTSICNIIWNTGTR
jgi:hypothetical protein